MREEVSEGHNAVACSEDGTGIGLKDFNTMGPDASFSGGWPESALPAVTPDIAAASFLST